MKISAPSEQFDYDVTCVIFVYLAWICQPFCIYGFHQIGNISVTIPSNTFPAPSCLLSSKEHIMVLLMLCCSSLRTCLFQSLSPVSFTLDNFDCYVFKSPIFVSSADSNVLRSQFTDIFISAIIFFLPKSSTYFFLYHLYLSFKYLNIAIIALLKYLSLTILSLKFLGLLLPDIFCLWVTFL